MIENRKYGSYLRFLMCEYRQLKARIKAGKGSKTACVSKNTALEIWADKIRELRKELNIANTPDEYIIITPDLNFPEYYTVLYKKPFIFVGTKEELVAHLWETKASYCTPSQYDCTGQHFTTNFKVGYLGGDRWKVAEYMAVDV